MRIIDLALKDIRQLLRDRRAIVFMIVMPLVFTFFFGFVFGGNKPADDPRLKIAVVNRDPKGILTTTLIDQINSSATVRAVLVDEKDAAQKYAAQKDASQLDGMILKGDYSAGLIIPGNFSAETLTGGSPKLEMVINEETDNGQTVRRALQTAITRVMGIAETAQLSAKTYEAQGKFTSGAERQAYLEDAVRRGANAWLRVPLSLKSADAAKATDPMGGNIYNQFSPGMLVMFAIFGIMQAAMLMVIERKQGAMARLLTTPMTRVELIAGHILGLFIIFFTQQLILVLFGQFALKVDYFRQPVAILLVMSAFALWVASLGLLISTLVKGEEQVVLFSMISMFLFSALGGSWFSLEMVGKTFSTIGHLTPTAWAIDGFQNIIMRGLGFESVLLPVGIILAYALAFYGLAVWKFRYE